MIACFALPPDPESPMSPYPHQKPPPSWLPLMVLLAIAVLGWLIAVMADATGHAAALWFDLCTGLGLMLAAIGLYMFPYVIGRQRDVATSGALFVVNLLFGWTVLGWFGCLIWAACGATRAQDAFFRRPAV